MHDVTSHKMCRNAQATKGHLSFVIFSMIRLLDLLSHSTGIYLRFSGHIFLVMHATPFYELVKKVKKPQ